MTIFKSENAAFKAAGDAVAARCKIKDCCNCGIRVLRADKGYKVLMVPDRFSPDYNKPYYL